MNFSMKQLIFTALIAVSIVLWAFFLNSSGLTLKEVLKFENLKETIGKIKSIEFILFVVLFPLTPAIATVFCQLEKEKINSFIAVMAGAGIGLIISLALFKGIQELWIAGILYFASFILLVEVNYVRLPELKKYVSLRLLNDSVKRTVLFTGIGLFIVSALMILPQQKEFEKGFEEQIISMTTGEKGMEDLAELSAEMLIQNQKEALQQITSTPQFKALKDSSDPNAVAFALGVGGIENQLDSDEYKQLLKEKILKEQGSSSTKERIGAAMDQMKAQIPLYGTIMQFLWLIESFALFSLFLLAGNTIMLALGVVYGLIAVTIGKMIIPK